MSHVVRYIVTWRAPVYHHLISGKTVSYEQHGEEDFMKLYVEPIQIGTKRFMKRRHLRKIECRVVMCQKVEVEVPLLRPAVAPCSFGSLLPSRPNKPASMA